MEELNMQNMWVNKKIVKAMPKKKLQVENYDTEREDRNTCKQKCWQRANL